MGALNAPREIPFSFKTFDLDNWRWVYDDSERTYLCCATPSIFAVPVAYVGDNPDEEDDGPWTDGDYFGEDTVKEHTVDDTAILTLPADHDERAAWDEAVQCAAEGA